MPLYQRTCEDCGFTEENIEKMSEGDIPKDCPECKKKDSFIKGISTGTDFRLKGEGWAEQGYTHEYTNSKAGRANKGGKHGTRKRFG